jgi:hypothetical protein
MAQVERLLARKDSHLRIEADQLGVCSGYGSFFPTAAHVLVTQRGFRANGSGGISISSRYCPNLLMCSVRYGLRRRTTSGVTHTPSCCSA